eukprot:sb/3475895/
MLEKFINSLLQHHPVTRDVYKSYSRSKPTPKGSEPDVQPARTTRPSPSRGDCHRQDVTSPGNHGNVTSPPGNHGNMTSPRDKDLIRSDNAVEDDTYQDILLYFRYLYRNSDHRGHRPGVLCR